MTREFSVCYEFIFKLRLMRYLSLLFRISWRKHLQQYLFQVMYGNFLSVYLLFIGAPDNVNCLAIYSLCSAVFQGKEILSI